MRASSPLAHAALSASAGTGKTHVLAARVLRLLLAGVDPASILCLTFTKAGAAEMAERIHSRLAQWVMLKEGDLGAELIALGESPAPEIRALARTLFARLLEATGGGLRIQTIHAFAQGLLAAFPAEAGLTPGFRPLEGREEQILARSTLSDLLVRSEQQGDLGLVRDVQALSLRLGEGGAESFLMACARAPEAMQWLGSRESTAPRLRRYFDLPLSDIDDAIVASCTDDAFDVASLRRIAALNRRWGRSSGIQRADLCDAWLAAPPEDRARLLDSLHSIWATSDGSMRSFGRGQAPPDPDYAGFAEAMFDHFARLLRMRTVAGMVETLAAGLRAGQVFAAAYVDAKRVAGVADFDDLIRWTVALLETPGTSDWVRFKLDQRIDHLLVDEAQDTNESQWRIVAAIVGEFFAGESAAEGRRTLFTVGDFKQAIFGFQGTDPSAFDRAREGFRNLAKGARAVAIEEGMDEAECPPEFLDLSIDLSFRSSPAILQLVDRMLEELGHEALGLPAAPNPHSSHFHSRPGSVTLWQPLRQAEVESDAGEEGWIADAVRRHADHIATQVATWLADPFRLECRKAPLRPEDILILVRRRGDLAPLLVARLHAAGVPVAGVDRLLLSAPLAVQDLLAAARFAVQPLDDLNLASLLVSPLFGWSQDQLREVALARDGALWPRLRTDPAAPAATLDGLQAILAMADYADPYLFFETILSGPLDGRQRLLARLGPEARDPIEELLSSALEFQSNGTASMQDFLDWFARGDVEVVRDPSGPSDAVRVMTVHGSKGLQAPVVILADACADPDRSRSSPGSRLAAIPLEQDGPAIPFFRPPKKEWAEPLTTHLSEKDRRDREEHWRLLYVALTRAEERLFVGGTLSARDTNGPPAASWFRAVEQAMESLGGRYEESVIWEREMRLGSPPVADDAPVPPPSPRPDLPDFLRRPAPVESRPPRPLSPSSFGDDPGAAPPPGPEARAAAARGHLLHQLFERLPGVDPARRRAIADRWLQLSAGVSEADDRSALIEDAERIIVDPRFASLFGPDSLAEAPIAAVVGDGLVVSGTIDRLLVERERVLIADFKTGRRPPSSIADIPAAHLQQMAAYREALRVIFPERRVETALLYTAGPTLHPLPDSLLDAHWNG